MENNYIFENIKQDMEALAVEHSKAADNERIWALGAFEAEDTARHMQYMEEHKSLARMYKRLANMASEIMEQFGDD